MRAVESGIEDAGWGAHVLPTPMPTGARLRWQDIHEKAQQELDRNGKVTYRAVRNELLVMNESAVAAGDVTFTVEAVGDTPFMFPDPAAEPVTIHGDSSMSWLLIPTPSNGGGRAALPR